MFLVFILLFVALILFVYFYKSGYRVEKKSTPGKAIKQNTDEASQKNSVKKSSLSDQSKSTEISTDSESVTLKGESNDIRENVKGSGADEHLNEINKYLNEIEEHLAGVIELGSKQTSNLPLGKDDIEIPEDIAEILALESDNEVLKKDRPTILIVDDNLPIRKYLISILRGSYNVLEEINGEKGLKVAREEIPDLIISDIMMPVMDGIEFCEEIRNDSSISYLPFIMLTSKIGDREKLKGLRSGADTYLQKPFNANVLLETVKNTLSSRKKLLEKIQQVEKGYTLPISSEDSFLEKLDKVINSRIDDHDLLIEDIANELNISVRQFQRKVKELSGLTPTKYLRYRRLKAAEYLLKNNSGSITEIAFAVGFNNLSLFSSYFKAEFNVLPSTLKSTNKGT